MCSSSFELETEGVEQCPFCTFYDALNIIATPWPLSKALNLAFCLPETRGTSNERTSSPYSTSLFDMITIPAPLLSSNSFDWTPVVKTMTKTLLRLPSLTE